MRLTTKGRYAVSALLYMALNNNENPSSLVEISTSQNISLAYLEQIFNKLKRANLVISFRGANGGYRLGHLATDINIAQIVDAVDESIDATNCGGRGDCNQGSMCLTHHLWEDLSDRIRQFLEGITLQQLIENRQQPQGQIDHNIEQMLQLKN